jgi:hypothetical protein
MPVDPINYRCGLAPHNYSPGFPSGDNGPAGRGRGHNNPADYNQHLELIGMAGLLFEKFRRVKQ